MPVADPKRRGRQVPGRALLGKAQPDLARPVAGAGRDQQFGDGRSRRGGQQIGQPVASVRPGVRHDGTGRFVGLDDFQRAGIEREHGVAGHLEQQLVAAVRMAALPVVELDLVLGVEVAALDGGDGAQVASDGHHRPAFAEADGGPGHGHGVAVDRRVVDLAPLGHAGGLQLVEQQFDLGTGIGGDGVHPAAADPFGAAGLQGRAALGHVADDALPVDHEGDVAGHACHGLGDLLGQRRQRAQVGQGGRGIGCHRTSELEEALPIGSRHVRRRLRDGRCPGPAAGRGVLDARSPCAQERRL